MAESVFIGSGGGGATPPLSAVLAVGNTSGANDILMVPAQQIDTDAAGTLKLGNVNATGFEIGKNNAPPGTDPLVLINQGGVQIGGSNAGIQYSTRLANRAQFRGNQFGANAAGPGVTGFKSRGPAIATVPSIPPIVGDPNYLGVIDGDLLFRITAIGVSPDNLNIPLAALLTFQVPPGGAIPASNYVATEYELQLVPLEGPINGTKVMFKITSQGVPVLRETALPAGGRTAGLATLGAAGTVVVANVSVRAGTRFLLTVQDGPIPLATGNVQVTARTVGGDFTIASSAGAADAGVVVYWQLWEGV